MVKSPNKSLEKSEIFNKTAVDQRSQVSRKSSKKLQRSKSGAVNYIERNKQLGRVADINRRRFSKQFYEDNEEKERMIRIKTMKRDAHTARMSNREKIHFFMTTEKAETNAVGSYKNLSVRERKSEHRGQNALADKVDPSEVYQNLFRSEKPNTAKQESTRRELGFSSSMPTFKVIQKKRPMTRQDIKLTSNTLAGKCSFTGLDNTDLKSQGSRMNNLCIQSENDGEVQFFTLFRKGLKKPKYEDHPQRLDKKKLPAKKRIIEKPIKAWRKENIHLETIMGKLLTSYAMMQPKQFDIKSKKTFPEVLTSYR